MKYDDASWHLGGNFPEDLAHGHAYTHTGMFLAWALLHGHGGSFHAEECEVERVALERRELTPGAYFEQCCDGKLTNEDLSDEGNDFARAYYAEHYLRDYVGALARDESSPYHVTDSWENYEVIERVLTARFADWKKRA